MCLMHNNSFKYEREVVATKKNRALHLDTHPLEKAEH